MLNLNAITKLNKIEPMLEFTFKDKTKNSQPFLNVLLIRDSLDFKVY